MTNLSVNLLATIDAAEPVLRAVTETDAMLPALTGGWSRKQLLGHLIDSAGNNHQRFVRAAIEGSLVFPAYDQNAWPAMQKPELAPWRVLVDLWAAYNRYLAHVVAQLPAEKLDAECRIGTGAPVTLGFIANDYLRHLKHHLAQIGIAL